MKIPISREWKYKILEIIGWLCVLFIFIVMATLVRRVPMGEIPQQFYAEGGMVLEVPGATALIEAAEMCSTHLTVCCPE